MSKVQVPKQLRFSRHFDPDNNKNNINGIFLLQRLIFKTQLPELGFPLK